MKKGDILKLINNEGMAAPIGSTARVTEDCKPGGLVGIEWIDKGDSGQMDGQYWPNKFENTTIISNKTIMEQSHLAIAKELIELKWNIKVIMILIPLKNVTFVYENIYHEVIYNHVLW